MLHRRRSVAQAGGGERIRDLFARQAEQRDLATCITEFYLRAPSTYIDNFFENRLMQVGGQRDDQPLASPHCLEGDHPSLGLLRLFQWALSSPASSSLETRLKKGYGSSCRLARIRPVGERPRRWKRRLHTRLQAAEPGLFLRGHGRIEKGVGVHDFGLREIVGLRCCRRPLQKGRRRE